MLQSHQKYLIYILPLLLCQGKCILSSARKLHLVKSQDVVFIMFQYEFLEKNVYYSQVDMEDYLMHIEAIFI